MTDFIVLSKSYRCQISESNESQVKWEIKNCFSLNCSSRFLLLVMLIENCSEISEITFPSSQDGATKTRFIIILGSTPQKIKYIEQWFWYTRGQGDLAVFYERWKIYKMSPTFAPAYCLKRSPMTSSWKSRLKQSQKTPWVQFRLNWCWETKAARACKTEYCRKNWAEKELQDL